MSDLNDYIFKELNDHYVKIKRLSENAISSLDLYEHKDSQKKVLLFKSINRNDEVFRRLNELDFNGYLPQIYLVDSDEEVLFVVQEYIEGKTAAELSNSDKKQVINYAIDVCNGLEILHGLDIVHRDVKPENVIIKNNKHASLIDLSIAKIIDNSERADTVNLGTIGYAAPEQFGFMQSRRETDIYALGVMINILLTGVHPMQDIPKGKIGKIIKKCTTLTIGDRYSNVKELKNDLKKIR